MPAVTRRDALGLGAALAAGALTGGITRPVNASAGTTPAPGGRLKPVEMAMHIHASFSEGIASMDAHLDQARRAGVDVIWWTEHDFRVQAHGYRREVRFDGPSEPEGQLDWTWTAMKFGAVGEITGTFIEQPHSPDEPGNALRLTAHGPIEDWGGIQYEATAWNSTYTTNLSDTTLELDVLAETIGRDAELIIELQSSHRPATGGRPAGQYTVQYRIGAEHGRSLEADGLLGVVARPVRSGWHRVTMRPARDIARLWPDIVARDSGLYLLWIAVRARRGTTASAVVDRLRFVREGRDDQAGLELQRELMRAYRRRYPEIRQYQGGELSLVRHLNRFGGVPFLPDYGPGPPFKDDSVEAAMAMVDLVHAHGGLVSYNHPLEGPRRQPAALARVLVETHNLGADLIEVGRQDVDGIAWAFDAAARNGIFVTATGVTDDHAGLDWLAHKLSFITTARAPSSRLPDLLSALGGGRVWFSDLAAWRGAMQISAYGAPAMGGVLVTPDRTVPLEVLATDLPRNSVLEIITGEVDYAGPDHAEPAITTRSIPAAEVRHGRVRLDLEPGAGRYVRTAVRGRDGVIVGFSNPIWVYPETPPGGIPPDRVLAI